LTITRYKDRQLPAFPRIEQPRSKKVVVSIVVVNHNYQRFLGEAVESALAQQGAAVEVIVVDDGSTDGSHALLAGYGARIRVLLQPNLGQTAAFNAGFAAAGGNVILYLDADDFLEPHIVAQVTAAFRRVPATARVVYRLAIVDEAGRRTGELIPPGDVAFPDGDVRQQVLDYGDDLAWPPTSGNAFAAWALRRVMPLPVTDDLTGGDFWLHPTIPLLGPVVALDTIGGAYRAHGSNYAFRPGLDVKRSRQIISRACRVHPRLRDLARDLGYGDRQPQSVTLAAHRMVSLRLGGSGHPVCGDTLVRVLQDGIRAAWHRRDAGLLRRVMYATWFVMAAAAPRAAVPQVAESFFIPSKRRSHLRRLLRR
jgi:Glycosyl transferase family 2